MAKLTQHEILHKLRSGEMLVCPFCGKTIIKSVGNPKKSHFYHCDNPKCDFNIKVN